MGEVERVVEDAEGTARAALSARLDTLREGSGRTYASLARRIGVSGSTLHRYCTGRTVPAEFAPVERLARLCGASAADREALHRLWLLADRGRVDRQGPGAPADAVACGPVPDERAGGEVAAEAEGPRTAGERPADPAREARGPEARGPSGPMREGGGLRPSEDRPRRARRYGQVLGGLAAASLVVALAATLGTPAPSGPDRGRSPAQWPGPPPVESPAPSRSGSPAAAAPPATPRTAPSRTPSDGGTGSAAPPGAGTRGRAGAGAAAPSAGPAAGRAPFTWTGDAHVWKNGCDHAYRVDRAPDAVPPPPVEADAAPWASALGAVHAGETGVRITVQGRDDRAVVLESLRIRVVERRPVGAGRIYRMSSGCGGSLTPRMFDVDLDAPRPVARPLAGNDSGEPVAAVAFPYRVSVTDPEVFLITGRTVGCDCDWFAELGWSGGGQSGTVRLDDGGRPFRTGGVRGRQVLDYDTTARRWVAAESGA
ncbi:MULTISPECIES: helix-turn-helix domain-containing protein [Streptomyces]|uniref:helix-turn-helix domain-containing protein n=1 Tax=Streptomyces TaxID=1883 RepID=UPI000A9DC44D|nr:MULTISPECIES: helix-turn-helix transcriptional regulator [Streptomyces]